MEDDNYICPDPIRSYDAKIIIKKQIEPCIEIKEGHLTVLGKDGWCQIPIDQYTAQFVYRPPNYPGPIAIDATIKKDEP
jgi:hypothetical protein